MTQETYFDSYAEDYDASLNRGLSVTGEDKDYFARGRARWLSRLLTTCGEGAARRTGSVLDFGCGTGSATPYLLDLLGADSVCGLDVSAKSVAIAAREHRSNRARFMLFDDYQPCGEIDLAFCNGVFHHIPLSERAGSVDYIYRSLRPGGLFAFWENNPWNPGTRYVMSRCPFDEDAVTLTPREARHLLRAGGFEILRTDYLFIFPKALHCLRGLEPFLSRLPLGGQYQVLCRKL